MPDRFGISRLGAKGDYASRSARTQRYDRKAIDKALDRLSGQTSTMSDISEYGIRRREIRVKGVNTVRRYRKDGTLAAVYYYHRKSGRLLAGEPGTSAFVESYGLAEKSIRERANGTITKLNPPF